MRVRCRTSSVHEHAATCPRDRRLNSYIRTDHVPCGPCAPCEPLVTRLQVAKLEMLTVREDRNDLDDL